MAAGKLPNRSALIAFIGETPVPITVPNPNTIPDPEADMGIATPDTDRLTTGN